MLQRIALISEHASPLSALGGVDSGGQNVYVAQVARHLAGAGCSVDVFTRRNQHTLPTVVDLDDGLRVIHVDAGPATNVPKEDLLPYMEHFARWTQEFIHAQGSYDVIHANFFMSGLIAMRLQQTLDIPFAITFHALGKVRRQHQGGIDRFPREREQIESAVMAAADAIIAECPQDQWDQRTLYGADPTKMHLIPCGFDRKELGPMDQRTARKRLGLSPTERIVLHVGRMVPRKGVDTAIEGFAELVHRHSISARMLIVGGESDEPDPQLTPEIGRLQQVAEQNEIAQLVTFVGRRSRQFLRDYYAAADVFVTTPWYEPFGITPVEAMACGVPVIGSDVGGIRYSVRHGSTGLLVPPNDAEAVGQSLAHLFNHPSLRAQMKCAAVERANRLFTWERVSRQILNVLQEIVRARRYQQREAVLTNRGLGYTRS